MTDVRTLPAVGAPAPDFALEDSTGTTHALGDYRGHWVLLYFYPKDNTPGCTTQACDIRDQWSLFQEHRCVVLGVSTDSAASHQKFSAKYTLPFTLLADTEATVAKAYGVWAPKKFMGREFLGTVRTSFLIDPTGAIARVYAPVNPKTHAATVLADLTALTA